MTQRLFKRLRRLPVWFQSILVTVFAIVGADALTFAFYWFFFQDRLLLDLVLTAIITIAVATPMSLVFLDQLTKLEALVSELRHASRTDHLTRIANRREFMSTVGPALLEVPDAGSAGALLFIDADRFKHINDTYGHAVGDKVLVALAEQIGDCIRRQDIAARIGGEEFAAFLIDADNIQAHRVAERIRTKVYGIGTRLGLSSDAVSVSIGIAIHEPGEDLESVLREADRSLYVAKNEGRNRIAANRILSSAA